MTNLTIERGYTYDNLINNYGMSEGLTNVVLKSKIDFTERQLHFLIYIDNDIIRLNMYDKHEIAHVVMWLYLLNAIDEPIYKYYNRDIAKWFNY